MTSRSATIESILAPVLPLGFRFKAYHVSTPPSLTCALYTPPTGSKPEKTYSESHLLVISHISGNESAGSSTAIFALEILIYTTSYLTTVFVSKADSTGFAADIPLTGSSSILRSIACVFVSDLVKHRLRSDRRLVISLFARSQDQYLFPGSAENKSKHILNDRQLVKWWCRTLDPLLRGYPAETKDTTRSRKENHSKAYLIVPGYDTRETSAFFPAPTHNDHQDSGRWHNDHPLRTIAPYDPLRTAPRSLIPHFPDDPKSRFLLDLDEEITDAPASQNSSSQEVESGSQQPSPSKRGTGMWKSVKSLEQFWEMMAWRQECSSGRLVGFIWITVTPSILQGKRLYEDTKTDQMPESPSLGPLKRKRNAREDSTEGSGKNPHKTKRLRRRHQYLRGIIVPRAPRIKTSPTSKHVVRERTDHFYWPVQSRGSIVVDEKAYQRVHEILLRLDFAGVNTARANTAKWVSEVAVLAGRGSREDWGVKITGKAEVESQDRNSSNNPGTNTVGPGLVRRKNEPRPENVSDTRPSESGVNTLGAGLIRKKAKA